MKTKNVLLTFLITSIFYYAVPFLFLHFSKENNLSKIGLILILFFTFVSFAINLIISFFLERNILIPIITSVLAVPLLYTFNTSAVVLIIIIIIFSFLAYGLSGLLK